MRRYGIILIMAVLTPLILMAAGEKGRTDSRGMGKIQGTITAKETGEPLVGASVLVVGTQLGAQADLDGKYVIQQVTPGVYTLRFTAVGYTSIEIQSVSVAAGVTTEQKVQLEKSSTELDKSITVVGKQDKLKIRETSNQAATANEAKAQKPATTVDELLSQSAGVAADATGRVYIRGGRAGEVSYIPDGSYPPAHGGSNIVNGEPFDAMFFRDYGVNPFVDTDEDHLSTFAADVDDASYILTRSYLDRGALPPFEAVRAEEFINHFDYGYDAPRRDAFRVYIDGAPSEFGNNSRLLRIGIKGREIREEHRKPANLVFVIDVSGSMDREDRLELVKRSLRLLVNELYEGDRVGIVIYGSDGRVLLEPTGIEYTDRILSAIKRLAPGGSTNAEEGIRLGYRMADRMFDPEKINRIILCSDGVANVGRTGPEEILKQIKRYAEKGITLTAVGFGMGNYNDVLLEKLGNKGNGFYAYVDNLDEARKIFVDNLTGTLEVIARDVKIQVDFNPEIVRSYRLIGYENRDVADNKFRDDREDGGEIGSGHEVTALYEIKLWNDRGSDRDRDWDVDEDEWYGTDDRDRDSSRRDKRSWSQGRDFRLGTVFIRYKHPDNGRVAEVNQPIMMADFAPRFDRTTPDFRLAAAAAEFGEILRKSYWAKDGSLADVRRVVKGVVRETNSPEAIELLNLVNTAQQFEDQLAER